MKRKIFWLAVFVGFCHTGLKAQTLTLQKALQMAKEQNPDLKAEVYQVMQSQADSTTAALRPNPTFHNETMQVVDHRYFAPNATWLNGQNRQTMFTVTKPFQLAGQRQKKIALAEEQIDLASKTFHESERQIFADVAMKWMEVYTAHKQLDILKIAKNNIDSLREINEVRLKNQTITQTDFLRTQLLADQYALKLKTAEQDLHNQLVELAYLVGSKESIDIDISDPFLLTGDLNRDSLLRQVSANRSDIQAAQSLMNVSNRNITLQRSLAVPVPEAGFMWNPQNSINYAGVTFTFELPTFSRNQGEIKKAYLLKDQSEQQYEAVRSKAISEITTAYASYQTQKQNTKRFTDGLLQQSDNILANVKYAYLRGGTTLIDFLEAQRSWLETQQQYYDALQQYRQSYIKLLYTSGVINQLAQ